MSGITQEERAALIAEFGSAEPAALAEDIDRELAQLRSRLLAVKAAMRWGDDNRAVRPHVGVLVDEIKRLRALLPYPTPLQT
jgi:hypothetical protein